MEGVPAVVIQEKMISKLKKKRQKLQDEIQAKCNLKENLDSKFVKELKESNEFFDIFKNYTARIEADAGLRQFTQQPDYYGQGMPPPTYDPEEHQEKKRESKFSSKLEDSKQDLPLIMKEEMKQMVMTEKVEEPAPAPAFNLNISKSKTTKKKVKQEIQIFVSKLSPEEKRAQMDKYKYDEKKISKELGNLKSSIAAKLASLKNRIG
eukprot:CAMPEP_0197012982 /NCGR_PEP_ID=MMETSP1380-20130617/64659_1 /TAXON_ID=5936 /ORGANISM="Euplotes crassus, Strain CT5" /LENGTH=206 /DNA_ID=CAMNT_0042436921 /DNA_START=255 /DNA_END=872 /DNA_ORIENTATION=+